jgi:hypothetical protein
MRRHERYLRFENIETGHSVTAWCSHCDRRFIDAPQPGDHIDEVLLRMRAEYEAHDCTGKTAGRNGNGGETAA